MQLSYACRNKSHTADYQSRVRNQYPIPLVTDERKEIRVWLMDLGAY